MRILTVMALLLLPGAVGYATSKAKPGKWAPPDFATLFSSRDAAVRASGACGFQWYYVEGRELPFVKKLTALLEDPSLEVKGCAGAMFKWMPHETATKSRDLILDTAVPRLIRILGDSRVPDKKREEIAYAVARMSLEGLNRRAEPLLRDLYRKSDDPKTRFLAISALTDGGYPPPEPETDEFLKEVVKSQDPIIRGRILFFWASNPRRVPRGIVPFLITLIGTWHQDSAIPAIANAPTEGRSAIPALIEVCKAPKPVIDPKYLPVWSPSPEGTAIRASRLRALAVNALGDLGASDVGALECILDAASRTEDEHLSGAALYAFGRLGTKASPVLPSLRKIIEGLPEAKKKRWGWVLKKIETGAD
jgi:hypothetical protein